MKMRSSSLHYRGGIYYLGDIDIGFIILYDSYKIFVLNINVKFNIKSVYHTTVKSVYERERENESNE